MLDVQGPFARAFVVGGIAFGLAVVALIPSYGLPSPEAMGSLTVTFLLPSAITGSIAKFRGSSWSWLKVVLVYLVIFVVLGMASAAGRRSSSAGAVPISSEEPGTAALKYSLSLMARLKPGAAIEAHRPS